MSGCSWRYKSTIFSSTYKIYSKILIKARKYDNAAVLIEQAIDNCGDNGDLYYFLAQIQKIRGDVEEYIKCMNNALKFNISLSVAPKLVKKELDEFLK